MRAHISCVLLCVPLYATHNDMDMQRRSATSAAAVLGSGSLPWRTAPAGPHREALQAPLPQHPCQDGGVLRQLAASAELQPSERTRLQHSGDGGCALPAFQGSAARQPKHLQSPQPS